MINIYCENTKIGKDYPVGTTLLQIIEDQKIELDFPIMGAMVNNSLKELSYVIYKPKIIKFFDYQHPGGKRMFIRSLSMVLFRAVHLLFPGNKLTIQHSVSGGIYCEVEGIDSNTKHHSISIEKIKKKMIEIINDDILFVRDEIKTEKALDKFAAFGLDDKCTLLKTRVQLYTSLYKLKER